MSALIGLTESCVEEHTRILDYILRWWNHIAWNKSIFAAEYVFGPDFSVVVQLVGMSRLYVGFQTGERSWEGEYFADSGEVRYQARDASRYPLQAQMAADLQTNRDCRVLVFLGGLRPGNVICNFRLVYERRPAERVRRYEQILRDADVVAQLPEMLAPQPVSPSAIWDGPRTARRLTVEDVILAMHAIYHTLLPIMDVLRNGNPPPDDELYVHAHLILERGCSIATRMRHGSMYCDYMQGDRVASLRMRWAENQRANNPRLYAAIGDTDLIPWEETDAGVRAEVFEVLSLFAYPLQADDWRGMVWARIATDEEDLVVLSYRVVSCVFRLDLGADMQLQELSGQPQMIPDPPQHTDNCSPPDCSPGSYEGVVSFARHNCFGCCVDTKCEAMSDLLLLEKHPQNHRPLAGGSMQECRRQLLARPLPPVGGFEGSAIDEQPPDKRPRAADEQ